MNKNILGFMAILIFLQSCTRSHDDDRMCVQQSLEQVQLQPLTDQQSISPPNKSSEPRPEEPSLVEKIFKFSFVIGMCLLGALLPSEDWDD
jgi:hypothetical protein